MLPADHPLVYTQNLMLNEFKSGSGDPSSLEINITWGIKNLETSKRDKWDPNDLGILEWDENFTVSPVPNQVALLEFCDYLTQESTLVRESQVDCWIKNLDQYVQR